MGHTAWAPEGREGRSQAGPKAPKPARRAATLKSGPGGAPRLLVFHIVIVIVIRYCSARWSGSTRMALLLLILVCAPRTAKTQNMVDNDDDGTKWEKTCVKKTAFIFDWNDCSNILSTKKQAQDAFFGTRDQPYFAITILILIFRMILCCRSLKKRSMDSILKTTRLTKGFSPL